MRIITLAYVAAFMVIQIGLMIFTCLDMVDTNNFLVELNTLVAILMIFVNANALVSYCRNAGNPYLNEKNKKYVRKFNVFKLPKILYRVEELLRYQVGEDIYVPLLVADETSLALAGVIEKADEVTKLKADIATDLAAVTKDIADYSETLKLNQTC